MVYKTIITISNDNTVLTKLSAEIWEHDGIVKWIQTEGKYESDDQAGCKITSGHHSHLGESTEAGQKKLLTELSFMQTEFLVSLRPYILSVSGWRVFLVLVCSLSILHLIVSPHRFLDSSCNKPEISFKGMLELNSLFSSVYSHTWRFLPEVC